MPQRSKVERFSYTKLDTYKQCGWKYKLQYVEGRFFAADTIATSIGTLVHWIEQRISEAYINGREPIILRCLKTFGIVIFRKKISTIELVASRALTFYDKNTLMNFTKSTNTAVLMHKDVSSTPRLVFIVNKVFGRTPRHRAC